MKTQAALALARLATLCQSIGLVTVIVCVLTILSRNLKFQVEKPMRIFAQPVLAIALTLGLAAMAEDTSAQANAGDLTSASSTRLITIGTRSGPRPTIERAQSSNLLIVNGTSYLVDAGIGTTRRLTEAGIRIADIGKIFISHGHDDHVGGLPALVTSEYNLGRSEIIDIYGPAGTDALTEGMIQFLTISSEIRVSDGNKTLLIGEIVESHEVEPGIIYRDDNVTVTAVENSHFNFQPGSPAYGKYRSYSYRFETADRTIVFTGDTGPSDALTEFSRGADLLVTEVTLTSADEFRERRIATGTWDIMTPDEQAGYLRHMVEEHLTQEEVGRMAERAGVKAVLLTHLPNSGDPDDDYERFAEQVGMFFSGEILVAEDLGEY
jgi:ribonuclease BN (tRNA processing enzyme)